MVDTPSSKVSTTRAIAKPALSSSQQVRGKTATAKGARARRKAPRATLGAMISRRLSGFRLRLLPMTIFVAVLMLGVRVGDLWRLATHSATLPQFPVTMAQNPPTTPAPAKPPADANTTPKPSEKSAGSTPAPDAGQAKPTAPLGPIDDQELAKQLSDRRAELDRRAKDLDAREALLSAAEKRVDQKVQELDKMRSEIQKLMKSGDDKQAAQVDNLVGIYEKMKPKEAARIFDEMALPQLLEMVPKMNPSKSSLIMAAMDPVKAKELSTALLEHRSLPAGQP